MPSPPSGEITAADRGYLEAFQELAASLGRPPSVRELAAHVGRSSAPVQRALTRLRKHGALPEVATPIATTPVVTPEKPASEKPGPPPPAIAAIAVATPAKDSMEAQAQAHRLVIAALNEAALDPDLSPRERRREIRVLAQTAGRLVPQRRLWEAEQRIRNDRDKLKPGSHDGPKMQMLAGWSRDDLASMTNARLEELFSKAIGDQASNPDRVDNSQAIRELGGEVKRRRASQAAPPSEPLPPQPLPSAPTPALPVAAAEAPTDDEIRLERELAEVQAAIARRLIH